MPSAERAPVRLLVVDDDLMLRSMAARTLRHAGFEVHAVGSGIEALQSFETGEYALLMLDVMMPGLDGFEVCRRVRALPQGADLPILMLTGLNDTDSIESAYAAGATDFITKPIHWTLLAQRVSYALRAAATAEVARRSRERLERAQDLAAMGHWELADDGLSMTCSPALQTILRVPVGLADRVTPGAFLDRVHAEDRAAVTAARAAVVRLGTPYRLAFRIQRFDGVERTVFEQAQTVWDGAGRRIGVEGITQDITERVDAERRIAKLAHYDALTGLPNRAFFAELVMPMLERAGRAGQSCALLYIDIDRFKDVNDAFGQSNGDAVLCMAGERLQASVRSSDITAVTRPSDGCVARVGANAYTLLLIDVGGERQAATVCERLLRAIAAPIELQGRQLELTASMGVSIFPRDGNDIDALARCAEQALYSAKALGRGQLRFFDETINSAASMRLLRESELRQAITQGELRLHYQPKVDAASGRIVAAEALVRWQHPTRGLVPPGEFIPLAEESGLILPLTDWVLEQACSDQRHRLDRGLQAVPVSVNLSSPSFASDGLLDQLDALIGRHAVPAASLTLEVTESLLMRDVEGAVQRLHALRSRGFKVSLDDFGTGFSSLAYLQRFPIDEIKIDRSFVSGASQVGRESAIVRSIIALAREFDLSVVAEGVESLAQSHFLLAQGCPLQQGYLFARPQPVEQFDLQLASGLPEKCAA
jgi:diguanylate cyclase (GGDEF)-like protein/PAS domain S-box-containing protein